MRPFGTNAFECTGTCGLADQPPMSTPVGT